MFDIDHLYLWSFDYDIEDNENGSQNVSIKDSSVNTLLKCALTILTNVDNSIQYLYKPVDSDTKLVKDVADEIQETNSLKHHAFNFGALHEQIERKNDYITGKVGIGPFALNVTNQELTRLSGVKFADSIITRLSNIGSLDNVVDTDDNPISAWESGFINSHVDIVKDPYISKLNVNQFTYNLCNLLTRSGFGETTLWFLCQPIIREMAAASNAAGSQYIRKGNKSVYTIREEAITKAAMKILNIEDVATFLLIMDRVNNPKDKRDYVYMAKSIQWILDNKELLKRIAIEYSRNPNIKTVKIGDVEYNIQNILMQVLVAYKSLNSYERGLSKLVQYTKIDTRKHGKNLIQIRRYLQNYTDMIAKADDDASVFDKRSLHNLVDKTWIDYKTKNAILLPFQILGGLTYNANDMFISQILQFADILNVLNDDVGEKLMTDLSRAAITAIKVNYIVNYAKTYEDGLAIKPKTDVDIAKLFTSSNALSKKLNRLLDLVRNNPKYQRLENNYLLQSISAEFEEDSIIVDGTSISKPSFITLSSTVTDNKNNGEILSEAWEDLLEDEDPFVRDFANDLIIYAFITSGEYNGWNKMFKYIPYNWIVGRTRGFDHRVESFAAYTQRMLAGDMIGLLRGQMLDDIVGNNFMNSSIIHASSIVDPEDNSLNFVRNDKGTMVIGKSVNNEEDAPQYISLQKPGTVGKYQADFDIFKLVGFYNMNPIYAQILKRGYHRDNGHDIYEYGWDFNYIENKSKPMAIVYEDDIQEAISILQDEPIEDNMSIIIGKITLETNDVVRRRNIAVESVGSAETIKPKNDPERFNDPETDENILSSSSTILSNEELAVWNSAGVGPMPRILVASERTDPAFHVLQILDVLDGKQSVQEWGVSDGKRSVIGNLTGKDFAGLYLITKHDGLPMEKLLKTKIPKLIHFSITGLGGTEYEPGVMKPDDLLDRISDYIKIGLDPNSVTVRIDPIVPGVTTPNMIRNIIKRASEMGIKRIRFSIMDAYPNTVESLSKLGYDFERNYGTNNKTGKINFNAKSEIINKIVDFMLQLKNEYGITLGTCAEGLVREGISKEGCLSVDAVNRMLGTSIPDKGTNNNTLRVLCSCYGGKVDALKYNASCASHCVYCYAKHENDKALQYYNEDGTLKDIVYTRTSARLQIQNDNLPGPETTINIYAGTGENADLSNFAYRPFDFREGYEDENSDAYRYFMELHPFLPEKFDSVEQAFQAFKWAHALISTDYAGEYLGLNTDERKDSESYKYGEKISNQLGKILDAKTSAEAKRLGGLRGILNNNDVIWWDNHSSDVMKFLLKQSFKQNPQALQRLLATGNATLTHTQDKGKWGTEFPRLLMEVREELRQSSQGVQSEQLNDNILSTKDKIPSSYVGMITPDENTIFVFGSNPEGIHGAGAANTAKTQFGAIHGQGEGIQGNAYALPTKDLNKARGTRWYRPGKKEEVEVKEWYKDHDYSEVQNHPLNAERTMTPQQIIESIKKLYEVAAQNPNKQFKVSHYPFGQLSLNGYLGEEMLAMFKQAGQIPSNVVFNKEWIDHWNDIQSDNTHSTEEFYTKQSMLDYVQDRIADGIPNEDIKITHYAETKDTDEYWVVEVKFSQDYKNSADHNNC